MPLSKFSKIKKGEIFNFPKKTKEYQYEGKERMYTRWGEFKGWGYSYTPLDDISGNKQTMTDREIEIDDYKPAKRSKKSLNGTDDYKSIQGIYLHYSGFTTHAGYVKEVKKISDDNIKVSFSDHDEQERFLTISFTASEISQLLKGKKILNKNDGKEYQRNDVWRASLKRKK
jgi:hypothetical protein